MSSSLDALNLEGAKSEELRSVIACIMDATAMDGGPRYSRRVIAALTRIIVCRAYAKPTLEVSHLIAAMSDETGRFEHVLWGVDRANPISFRVFLQEMNFPNSKVQLTNQGLLNVADGVEFQISFARMPLLAAFVEFLITAFGYERLDALTAPIRLQSPTERDVGDVANALQRELYAYLKDHLPAAHRQKRDRHFLGYIDEHAGNRGGADAITDNIVLAYWQDYAAEPGLDNKTYRSVHEMAVRMVIALDAAAERVKGLRAASIGTDREAGEYDPEDVEAVMAVCDPNDTPLSRVIEQSADDVKFITATEADILSTLPMRSDVERRVPISIIRNAVQGAIQLKFSSALRQATSPSLESDPNVSAGYRNCLKRYQDIATVLERIMAAALWVLYSARHPSAISLALTLAPDIHWDVLASKPNSDDEDADVESIDVHRAMIKFFEATPDKRSDEVQALLAEAREAYRSINRKGFTEPRGPQTVTAMAAGVDDVVALISAIRRYTDREVGNINWEEIEREDMPIFQRMFDHLYRMDPVVLADGG